MRGRGLALCGLGLLAACSGTTPADAGADPQGADAGAEDAGYSPLDCHEAARRVALTETWLGRNFLHAVTWTAVAPAPPAQGDNTWTFVVTNAQDSTEVPMASVALTVEDLDGTVWHTESGFAGDDGSYTAGPVALATEGPAELTVQVVAGLGGDPDTIKEIFCVGPSE